MLHNRRLIARSCPIKSIDLGPSPDNNCVRTVSNGSIYLALVSLSHPGARFLMLSGRPGEAAWQFRDGVTHCPSPGYWHISLIVPCYVQICHNVTRHLTSHRTLLDILHQPSHRSGPGPCSNWVLQNRITEKSSLNIVLTDGDFKTSTPVLEKDWDLL